MKAILLVLLAAVSGNAAAQLLYIGRSETSTTYAYPDTIRRTGDIAKMWSLIDLDRTTEIILGKPFLSIKQQDEYDCKEERARSIYMTTFTKGMGQGESVSNSRGEPKWVPVQPGSMGESMWKVACDKK